MASLATSIDKAKGTIQPMLDTLNSGHGIEQLRVAMQQIISTLRTHDLALDQQIRVKRCGVHSTNRFGEGLDLAVMTRNMKSIIRTGFVFEEFKCICFEVPSDPATRDAEYEFNRRLAVASHGHLPSIEKHDLQYLAIASSHSTAAMRAIQQGCYSDYADVCDENNKICTAKVYAKCPSYKEPIENGVPALVIRSEVLAAFPGLPDLLQDAANATHEAIGRQTKVATLLQIYKQSRANQKKSQGANWTQIANKIERSKGHLKGQVADMCAFVQNYGGADGECIHDLCDYATTIGEQHRDIAGVTFGVMSKLCFQQGPRFVIALAKACLVAPAGKDPTAKLFTSTDLASLGQTGSPLRVAAIELQTTSEALRKFLQAVPNMEKGHMAKYIGDLEVRMVLLALKKVPRVNRAAPFKTTEDIAKLFFDEVLATYDYSEEIAMPYMPSGLITSAESPSSKADSSSSPFADSSPLYNKMLLKNGSQKGVIIKTMTGDHNDHYIFKDTSDGNVTIELATKCDEPTGRLSEKKAATTTVLPFKMVIDDYQVAPTSDEVGVLVDETFDGLDHDEVATELLKVRMAVCTAYKSYQKDIKVEITVKKGSKGVVASKDYPKGALRLVPLTPNLGCGTKIPSSAIDVPWARPKHNPSLRIYLSPKLEPAPNKFKVPLWYVAGSPDSDVCNVVWSHDVVVLTDSIGATPSSAEYKVPVLVNRKAIAAGFELIYKVADPNANKRVTGSSPRSGKRAKQH
ncbi:unnamed protein product [Prorocentrum cordatum]|uniref:Uncharacterized protein n=1 Tax=Prorocentrum cordatum TaxID=2364126 RepID=A0ABN9Y6Z9_9DINO|nr:unnamed protein product [Polarella glacialis]